MTPIRIGVVAASRIAEAAVVKPAGMVDGVELVAVAARSEERAKEAALRWGLSRWFGSYTDLMESGEVDAVYIATPATLHFRPVIDALDAGLHILCEKPFAANGADARMMAEVARQSDRVVMEAFHWRYHPFVEQMRAGIAQLGPIGRVDAWFEVEEGRIGPDDIRWDIALGGGATMDLGCYAIAWVRWAVGSEPRVVAAVAEATEEGVDAWLRADLEWDHGVQGSIRSSMVSAESDSGLVIEGERGTMVVDNPLAPHRGASLVIETGPGHRTTEEPNDTSTTYSHQLRAFRDAVTDGAEFPTTADEAVANMDVVDACYLMAGLPVRPGSFG
jgi:predicted dehydrogenase